MKTPEDKKKFLKALEETPFVSLAAKRAGIAKSTVYRWRDRSAAFARMMKLAQARSTDDVSDLAEGQIVSHIRNGSLPASRFWLENHRKEYIKPRAINLFTNLEKNKQSLNQIQFVDFSEKKPTHDLKDHDDPSIE